MARLTPADYFAQRGFRIVFTQADGYTWATLIRLDDPSAVLGRYGRGADEPSAASRAMQRWTVEQGD